MPLAIAELGFIVGLFFAIVGYTTARGLLATWTHSLGYLLQWLGEHLRFHIHIRGVPDPRIDLGGPFRAVDRAIVTALQNWCTGAEIEMGYCLHGLERVGRYMAQAIDYLARETSETFDWLIHVHIPKWVKYAATAAFPFAWITKLVVSEIAKHLPHIRREIKVIEHAVPQRIVQVFKFAGAATLPGVLGLPHIWREIHGLTKRNLRLSKRLHRVEALLGVAAFAGVLAQTFGVSARCVRSGGPIGRVARRLCGLSARGLEDILGLIVDAFLFTNICQALTLIERGFSFIEPEITAFITAVETMACYGDDEHLPPGPGVFLSLPPVTGLVLSLD